MDYPKSVPGVGLVGGRFVDENPVSGQAGSIIASAWANSVMDELLGVITEAGMTPQEATLNQVRLAIKILAKSTVGTQVMTFAQIAALPADQGPIICSDMGGQLYLWTTSAYFNGYRNPRCGLWYGGAWDDPEDWELLANGGTMTTSNPKHARVIAKYREKGRTVSSAAWAKGTNAIADLGSGNWKLPDLRDVFQRMSGTDADTANVAAAGFYQADALQNIVGTLVNNVWSTVTTGASGAFAYTSTGFGTTGTNSFYSGNMTFDASRVARTSAETRSAATRVSPVILV